MKPTTPKQARRKANEAAFKKLRNKQAAVKGTKPARSPKYLRFIRSCACTVCHSRPAEPCHVGVRGLRQKCSDFETVPMCRRHHNEQHQLGNLFWQMRSLDRVILFEAYLDAYTRRKGKPFDTPV